MKIKLPMLVLVLLLSACAKNAVIVPAASAEQKSALLDEVKKMAGTWTYYDEKNARQGVGTFAVTSGGAVVREVMFPGKPHEMTNMFHMDGQTLVATHYCAGGNQPRMRAKPGKPGELVFKLDSVSNLTSKDTDYMGELTLTRVDANTVKQTWTSFKNGKASPMTFTLKRKA